MTQGLPSMLRGRTKESVETKKKPRHDNGGNLGFEARLWRAADALSNNMDAADYKRLAPACRQQAMPTTPG